MAPTDSAAFAQNPVVEVLHDFFDMVTPVAWAGVAVLVVLIVVRRAPDRRAVRGAAGLAVIAAIWVAEVAYMTNDGFSGNARYLIMPAAIVCLLGGLGIGWLVAAVPRVRSATGPAAAGLAVLAALAMGLPAAVDLPAAVRSVTYQSRLNDGVGPAIERAGGAAALRRCGTPYTGPFQVPVVAWHLGLHTNQVTSLHPAVVPAVVFRVANARGRPPVPSLDSLGGEAGVRTVSIAHGWRIVERCR